MNNSLTFGRERKRCATCTATSPRMKLTPAWQTSCAPSSKLLECKMKRLPFEEAVKAEKAWNLRVNNVPFPWRGPLVDVIDTIESVRIGLTSALEAYPSEAAVLEVTRMVLAEKYRDKKGDEE